MILLSSFAVGYRLANRRARSLIKIAGLAAVPIVLVLVLTTDYVKDAMVSLLSVYANRSGLTDEYGRFSIWNDAISIWWEENILFGVGLGQIQYYTATGRTCHNTWLEVICGCGIFVGLLFIFAFGTLIVQGLRSLVKQKALRNSEFACTMVLGTMGVIISLFSVDNITFSYLWFGAFTVAAISSGYLVEKANGKTN